MALVFAGTTAHYTINYDDSLSAADGQDRALALLAVCEQDYQVMSGWFGDITLTVGIPVAVNIVPGGYASAGWGPPISLRPGNGSGLDVVRFLLVAEVTEMFMLAQNKGWFASDGSNEGAAGEGLSRVLSAEWLRQAGLGFNEPGFDTARFWLNSDRLDYVNSIDEHDHAPDEKSGCATLFIYWLSYQLGYDLNRIIAAAAPTLGGVYANLTGIATDPFPAFKAQLDQHFPRFGPDGHPLPITLPSPNPDNPYPLDITPSEVPVAIRIFWRMNPGRNVVNLNWPALSADSVVMISASEYNSGSQQLTNGTDQRFVGSASISVANVTPHGPPFDPNHGVTFVVDVGWAAPLNICTDIALIVDSPLQAIYIGPQTSSGVQAMASPTDSGARHASQHNAPVTYHQATLSGDGHRPTLMQGSVETRIEASL
ncbi:MAG: hypothetical protein ABI112_05170 [Terracoccus sp.]